MSTSVVTSASLLLCHASTCLRMGSKLRCIRSTPTEMQSISENDLECFAGTGVNAPRTMFPDSSPMSVFQKPASVEPGSPRAQIEKAKHLLILTDLSITDVCMAVAFSSLGSFSALFSRRVGMSPSEFQRRYRPASLPERQLPVSLGPGCLSLMAGISEKEQFSRRQPVDEAGTV